MRTVNAFISFTILFAGVLVSAVPAAVGKNEPPATRPTTRSGDDDLRRMSEEVVQLEVELDRLKAERQFVSLALEEAKRHHKPTPEDWGRVDRVMARLIISRDELQLTIRGLIVTQGDTAPRANPERTKPLEAIQSAIREHAQLLDEKFLLVTNPNGESRRIVSKDLKALDRAIDVQSEKTDQLGQKVGRMWNERVAQQS